VKTRCARGLGDELDRAVVRNGCAASRCQLCCNYLNVRMILYNYIWKLNVKNDKLVKDLLINEHHTRR
jgi:hypothetical protein